MTNSIRIYVNALLLAGIIAILFNLNVLQFNEEFLIAAVSCVFFSILFRLSRHFVNNLVFKEIDSLFLIFLFILTLTKTILQKGKNILRWTRLCQLNFTVWINYIFKEFCRKIRFMYIFLYKSLIKQLLLIANINLKLINDSKIAKLNNYLIIKLVTSKSSK